jgi:zinc transport system substrate-binding protein
MEAENKVEVFRLLPEALMVCKDEYHSHEHHEEEIGDKSFDYDEFDSHFWTDPMVVKHLLPILVQKISEIDPENSSKYKANADNFAKKLVELDSIASLQTKVLKDKPLFLFHPSFLYFIKRYELTYGGSIEWNPGTENTPNSMANLINKIKSSGVKAIFSEPQLPNKSAIVLAEQTGTKVFQLDPLGGTKELATYYDLIMYNIKTLRRALD